MVLRLPAHHTVAVPAVRYPAALNLVVRITTPGKADAVKTLMATFLFGLARASMNSSIVLSGKRRMGLFQMDGFYTISTASGMTIAWRILRRCLGRSTTIATMTMIGGFWNSKRKIAYCGHV